VKFSPAISLEPYYNDLEFGSNKNFADRSNSDPNIFQLEQHYSLYTYTVTIDLDRLGKDENENIELDKKTRIERAQKILEALKVMNREIKGRIENLNPIFVIGGIYPVKNPFFLNRVKICLDSSTKRFKINTELINSVLNISINGISIKDYTHIGLLKGYWENEKEFENAKDIDTFFKDIKEGVQEFYESA
ncbi:MAG: type I-B CRISPR-associated protein Cas7/Cst2/DevR, partial [Thermoproteota archaeon]